MMMTDGELKLKVAQLCGCSVDDVANIEQHSDGSVMADIAPLKWDIANRGGRRYFAAKALTAPDVVPVAPPSFDVERVVAELGAPADRFTHREPTRAPHITKVTSVKRVA